MQIGEINVFLYYFLNGGMGDDIVLIMKIFCKQRFNNGRRHIYFCGMKIISYQKGPRHLVRGARYRVRGKNNRIFVIDGGVRMPLARGRRIAGLDIIIVGNNNTVTLELPIVAEKSKIVIENDDVTVDIGTSPCLKRLRIDCRCGAGQVCKIGSHTTCYGVNIKLAEHSGCIIGRDCMLSNSINIWASDGHSVLDAATREILNQPSGPVVIGDHVWIGEGARITKRARIHNHSIVSGGAVCYRDYGDAGVVIAGNPGQIVRRGISWDRLNPAALAADRQRRLNEIPHISKSAIDGEIDAWRAPIADAPSGRRPRIIVSLTSFPARMGDIHYTLFSLLKQTVVPDEIVLWLGADKFPNREKDLPESVLRLVRMGIRIQWCTDMRSYTKLVPALQQYPDDIIITVDDDIFYPEYLVEKLYDAYLQNPDMVHCMRAHRVGLGYQNNILPYNMWHAEIQGVSPSYGNFQTGVGGVLYPPHCLCGDVVRADLFQHLAPSADDVWFWAMAVKNGTKINVVKSDMKLVYVNPARELGISGEVTLASSNVRENQNDVQIAAVINFLGLNTGVLSQ